VFLWEPLIAATTILTFATPREHVVHRLVAFPSLDDRFHETYQFGVYTRRPHPEECALARVSKDGGLHGHCLRPSFETHRLRDAPQDEVGYHSNLGNTPLVSRIGIVFINEFNQELKFTFHIDTIPDL